MTSKNVRTSLSGEAISALAQQGLTVDQAALQIGCCSKTIRRHAKANRVRFRHGNTRLSARLEELTPEQDAALLAALEAALANVEAEDVIS
jgi:transposase-like protein